MNEVECYLEELADDLARSDEDEEFCAETIDEGRYPVAVELMDDEIREDLHARLAPCTDYTFLREYVLAHRLKFGEDFRLN